ncbi:MAG: DUF2330 domain-containing protein [Nannocystaceae bacterium]|nr:DUF2330 domain-containing protein [Nannocystaceae bacterium]
MRAWIASGAMCVALGLTLTPADAEACGGTFCDAGPVAMPVDQSGENILFVIEDGTVEAHVQIQYQGDPEAFAWVVPVMAVPEIEAGSDALFQNMLSASVPTFQTTSVFEDCGSEGRRGGGFGGCSAEDASAALESDSGANGVPFDDGDPQVVSRGTAGAFEYAVLEGGTIEGVVDWLEDNGYAQDDEAPAELQAYLDKDFLFVAFKLRGGTGVDEIHPVVIRYEGDEPCVPIRLTRIAATDDMGVRAFFLGESRVAPTNYRSVELNLAAIDWQTLGANYESVVTQAVDAEGSEGHGFVTEYAGASSVVLSDGILDSRWDARRYREATPQAAVDELGLQGLLSCRGDSCSATHPLIAGVLERFLPRPAGVSFEAYYGCISCSEDADLESWDPGAFADELEARIIGPAEHAIDVLNSHRYLTRLYTTLSPQEMTLDPIFHETADLEEVTNVHDATMVFACEGPDYVEFDDGTRLALAGAPDPAQPAALRVQEVPLQGPAMTLADHGDEAADARREWNVEQGLGGSGEGCNCRARKHGVSGMAWAAFMVGLGMWARRPRRPRVERAKHRSS